MGGIASDSLRIDRELRRARPENWSTGGVASRRVGEWSQNAGGLIRWPIKFVLPAGFVLLALQGVSEVIKRVAALRGAVTIDAKYERPMQ